MTLRKKLMSLAGKKRDDTASPPSRKMRHGVRDVSFPVAFAHPVAMKALADSPRGVQDMDQHKLAMRREPVKMSDMDASNVDVACEDAFIACMDRLSQRAQPSIRLSLAIDEAISSRNMDDENTPANNGKENAFATNPRYSRMVPSGTLTNLNVRGLEECHRVQDAKPKPPKRMNAAPQKTSLPPMHIDVDPAEHYCDFVAVGSGASGCVFFATSKATGRTVALKRVQPSTRSKTKALENEIRTMHALRHPNIIGCHEAYSHQGSVWIVMEAMDVGCLTHVLDFLRQKGYLLDEAHIAYILLEALQGLWAMHSTAKIHRDLKSDNVLVSSAGEVKLADFEYTAELTADVPKRRTMVGTPWFMAPETVRRSYYDYCADVWSIGILAIECAEWVPPLFGMDCARALDTIKQGDVNQGFKRPEMWSAEFADFVHGCLTRDRAQRYSVPQLLKHPFLKKACSQVQMANVFRAVRGMEPISTK